MTGTNFAAYIRNNTRTNSTTLTDTEIVLLANVEKDNLAELIVGNVDEGYFNMTDTRDLEANVRNYTYPADMLKSIRYVAAKLDGTNWSYLTETDFGYIAGRKLPLLENSWIRDEFSNKYPQYLLSNQELWLMTGDDIIAVDEGLKLVSEVYPEDITTADLSGVVDLAVASSNTAVRLPRQAHKIWAHMVSISYKTSKDKPLPLTDAEKKLAIDLSDLYSKLRGRNAVRVTQGSVPYDDGQDY
jgi:hypothetical protein